MPRHSKVLLAVIPVILCCLWAWRTWWPTDEQRIKRGLNALATDFNESTTGGVGGVARAAKIGSYFTHDIVVQFAEGTPPIRGRDTLMGMVARLQPRTAAFTLELVDIDVVLASPVSAQASLTAAFRRRSLTTEEESLDAQELSLDLVKVDGEWRISRVTTVEPFK